MNSTFRQLRLFLALADEGSVSRAAQLCHVTQPTASMQLKELSLSVGLPLYEVIGKKVHLTEAGRELAQTARTMLGEWSTFAQKIDRMKGLSRGQLRVAVVSTAKYFIPRMLGQFCQTYPEIDITFEVLNRTGVVDLLRENKLDLAVMSVPPSDLDVETDLFMHNPLIALCPKGHDLAQKKRVSLKQFTAQPLIMREVGSGTRMVADRFFTEQGVTPRIKLTLGSNEAIKQAVAGGLGCAILSQHSFVSERIERDIAIIPVEGFPLPSQWFIVYGRGKKLSPIADIFRTYLREAAKTLDGQ
jgi:DNA-binding transcriptional LysR family regulator